MRYKVTFDSGQVSVYDTKTPLDEFKTGFTTALSFEVLDESPAVENGPDESPALSFEVLDESPALKKTKKSK